MLPPFSTEEERTAIIISDIHTPVSELSEISWGSTTVTYSPPIHQNTNNRVAIDEALQEEEEWKEEQTRLADGCNTSDTRSNAADPNPPIRPYRPCHPSTFVDNDKDLSAANRIALFWTGCLDVSPGLYNIKFHTSRATLQQRHQNSRTSTGHESSDSDTFECVRRCPTTHYQRITCTRLQKR